MNNPFSRLFRKYHLDHEIEFNARFEDLEIQKRYLKSIKPKKRKVKKVK